MEEQGNYGASFGNMPDRFVYSNPCGFTLKSFGENYSGTMTKEEMNKRFIASPQMKAQIKALTSTTGGSGSTDKVLVPIFVDPQIVDITRKFTPLVEIIPRVTNRGRTADFNKITAKGGAFARAEDSSLTETNDTYERDSVVIKYLYAKGRVTGQALATVPPYNLMGFNPNGGAVGSFSDQNAPNAMQMEVLVKTRSIRELEENMIINGNATTSGISGNPNGTEFDGIIATLSTTNTVDKNTTALEYDDIEEAIQYAFDDGGRPTIAVGSSSVVKDTRKLLVDQFRWSPADSANGVLPFGVPSGITLWTMVGPVTLIPSMFLSNTTGSKAMYLLDMTVIEMRVLQDLTFEQLAKTADSTPFMLKIYEALIIRAPTFCASITEIA
jgi:hypothetical protein